MPPKDFIDCARRKLVHTPTGKAYSKWWTSNSEGRFVVVQRKEGTRDRESIKLHPKDCEFGEVTQPMKKGK